MCPYVLSSLLWCPLRFPHKNDVRFVFTFSCLLEGWCLIYVICICLRSGVQQLCFYFASESVYRTLKWCVSIGVFVVYIDTGSPVRYIPSKSCDIADENNEILKEWNAFWRGQKTTKSDNSRRSLVNECINMKIIKTRKD
jgi:hypothetical protein